MVEVYGPGHPDYSVEDAKNVTPSRTQSYLDKFVKANDSAVAVIEQVQQIIAVNEQEKTKRLKLELHYQQRRDDAIQKMEQLRTAMQDQSKTDAEYQTESFKVMHALIDAGHPELGAEAYKLFVLTPRKPIMDHLIEFYDRIYLGKVRIQRQQSSETA